MRRTLAGIALAVGTAGPAAAAGPSAWIQCDGLPKPETVGSALGRVVAISATAGLFGMPEAIRAEPAARGEVGVKACDTVLAELPAQPLSPRRVSALRARAIHKAEAGDLDAALVDLQSIHGAVVEEGQTTIFARTLGASAQLFEAAVLAKRGRHEEAEALAIKAADSRPYSTALGHAAARILSVDPRWTAEKDRVLTRLVSIDPEARLVRAELREAGGPIEAAAADWALVAAQGPGPAQGADALLAELVRPLMVGRAAVVAARAGREVEARRLLAGATVPAPAPRGRKPDPRLVELKAKMSGAVAERMQTFVPLVDAWLSAGGDAAAAKAKLESVASPPAIPSVAALMDRLTPQTGAGAQTFSEQLRLSERRDNAEKLDVLKIANTLPLLEGGSAGANSFSSQGMLGLKANGFKDRAVKGSDARTIEFVGANSPQAAVEEMMLLRAAQLAAQAGKAGFLVTGRRDYRQQLVSTMYGAEVSRSNAGFKSEADVVFVDPAAIPAAYAGQADRVLDAQAVWAALSPVYVKPKT